jgi:hypothetical protein
MAKPKKIKGIPKTHDQEPVFGGRRGKTFYGMIVTTPAGQQSYLAYRELGNRSRGVFRGRGKKSLVGALKDKTACWAFDLATLNMLKLRDINLLGVFDSLTGDIYMTTMDHFDKHSVPHNFAGIGGGSVQRRLNLTEFSVKRGKIKV